VFAVVCNVSLVLRCSAEDVCPTLLRHVGYHYLAFGHGVS